MLQAASYTVQGSEVSLAVLSEVVRTPAVGRVPPESLARFASAERVPSLGDVVLAEIEAIGEDDFIEVAAFPWRGSGSSDVIPYIQSNPCFATKPLDYRRPILAAIGGRYAVDYLYGEVPDQIEESLELFTFGGVVGKLRSVNSNRGAVTRVRPISYFRDRDNRIVNTRQFAPDSMLSLVDRKLGRKLILVTGGSMESGKTTAAAATINALTHLGLDTYGIKVTGCGTFRDSHRLAAAGAKGVTEFMALGYPSTSGLSASEVLTLFWNLIALVDSSAKSAGLGEDYAIVAEIADGASQAESSALLQDRQIQAAADELVYAAPDSLSALGGTSLLSKWGWSAPLISGPVVSSPIGQAEVSRLLSEPHIDFLDSRAGVEELSNIWRNRLTQER